MESASAKTYSCRAISRVIQAGEMSPVVFTYHCQHDHKDDEHAARLAKLRENRGFEVQCMEDDG